MSKFVMIAFVAFSIGMAVGFQHLVQTHRAPVSVLTAHDARCSGCVSVAIRDQYEHPQWSKRRPIVPSGTKRSI